MSPAAVPGPHPGPAPDASWDAGDLGCGELVLELRMRLARLRPGQVLELVARDPGAPADLPAWCRMTGHALLAQRHPVYHIRRKEP
jgi:tRNA 2-thiouridine synthesizing protein A